MRTRVLMIASASFLAALGVAASFAPREILAATGSQAAWAEVLVVQVAGALCLGLAMLNWMARANLIGGVYSRPVALGNFLHWAVVAIALLKALSAGHRPPVVVAGAVIYLAFAASFGVVLLTSPVGANRHE